MLLASRRQRRSQAAGVSEMMVLKSLVVNIEYSVNGYGALPCSGRFLLDGMRQDLRVLAMSQSLTLLPLWSS